jgi:hypothetical protein
MFGEGELANTALAPLGLGEDTAMTAEEAAAAGPNYMMSKRTEVHAL